MDQFLGVAEAARVLGVVPATVRQMERRGQLPALRTMGGVRFFRRADVEHFAAERARARAVKERQSQFAHEQEGER